MNPSASSTAAKPPSKIKRFFVGLVVALIIGVSLFGYGFWKGRSQLDAQKAESDTQLQGLQAKLDKSQSEIVTAQNQALLFQAQASLYETAIDLEKRNFGLANTHLHDSAATLGKLQNGGGLDLVRFGELRNVISKTNINVAVNLAAQRQQVLDFATQLEAQTPKIEIGSTSVATGAIPADASPLSSPTTSSVTDANAATGEGTASGDANTTVPAATPPALNDTANTAGAESGVAANAAVPSETAAPIGTMAPAESTPTAAPVG